MPTSCSALLIFTAKRRAAAKGLRRGAMSEKLGGRDETEFRTAKGRKETLNIVKGNRLMESPADLGGSEERMRRSRIAVLRGQI